MKKKVKISDNLRNIINQMIITRTKVNYWSKIMNSLWNDIIKTNTEENKKNIIWVISKNGKIGDVYWQDGLTKEELVKINNENNIITWSLEKEYKSEIGKIKNPYD